MGGISKEMRLFHTVMKTYPKKKKKIQKCHLKHKQFKVQLTFSPHKDLPLIPFFSISMELTHSLGCYHLQYFHLIVWPYWKGSLQIKLVKMRPYCIFRGPTSTDWCLCMRRRPREAQERRPCWRWTQRFERCGYKPRTTKKCQEPPEARKRQGRILRTFRGNMTMATT